MPCIAIGPQVTLEFQWRGLCRLSVITVIQLGSGRHRNLYDLAISIGIIKVDTKPQNLRCVEREFGEEDVLVHCCHVRFPFCRCQEPFLTEKSDHFTPTADSFTITLCQTYPTTPYILPGLQSCAVKECSLQWQFAFVLVPPVADVHHELRFQPPVPVNNRGVVIRSAFSPTHRLEIQRDVSSFSFRFLRHRPVDFGGITPKAGTKCRHCVSICSIAIRVLEQ
mmetsp:Transcript_12947/g.25035  ORF Transcript_12947/g.25035 Transcript_12947/m.25035 type:complete len:223 (+) Transcript_12947:2162-2830(+)